MTSESFFALTPDRVLAAAEAGGVACTGLCYPLNSLENRVYEIEREDRSRVVAKFYRPGRWSLDAVRDEHRFLRELSDNEVPVAAPLPFPDGDTVREVEGIRYAVFPRVGGRAPDELSDDQLRRLGALLGRIHNVGALSPAPHRRALDPLAWGRESLDVLRAAPTIPPTLRGALSDVTEDLLAHIAPLFEDVSAHRIHGDCHLGNLLFGPQGPFFLDFDDMATGPAAQDVWLLTPGRDAEALRQRDVLLEGYETFRAFDRGTLELIEPLRALRYLHYAAWITRRWSDPSFPAAFPHYGSTTYWAELVADIEEQRARVTDEPLATTAAAVSAPAETPSTAARVSEVAFGSDDFLRVLMVRDEVFTEEMGRDPDADVDGLDGAATHLLARDPRGMPVGVVRVVFSERSARLSHLAVLPTHRRRGVAAALAQRAAAHARSLGARRLTMDDGAPEGVMAGLGFARDAGGWAMTLDPTN